MKTCSKCNIEKNNTDYAKNTARKDGLRSECKSCFKLYTIAYYKSNFEKKSKYSKDYYNKNKTKCVERIKAYYDKNATLIKQNKKTYYQKNALKYKQYRQENSEYFKQYYKANSEKIKKNKKKYDKIYQKERRKIDPLYKLSQGIRNLIRGSFTRNCKNFRKQSKTIMLLGCTIPELRDHLAKQFQKGMTFENYGKWQIDHRIPLASAKTQEEVEKLCHYTNLQPLWAIDNIKKGDNI